jgi:hypothetical protein
MKKIILSFKKQILIALIAFVTMLILRLSGVFIPNHLLFAPIYIPLISFVGVCLFVFLISKSAPKK